MINGDNVANQLGDRFTFVGKQGNYYLFQEQIPIHRKKYCPRYSYPKLGGSYRMYRFTEHDIESGSHLIIIGRSL